MYGERIRQLRKENNMTLRELSEKLKIPFTTLGNYEREDREPSFKILVDIANFFGVSVDYFTGKKNGITSNGFLKEGYIEEISQLFSETDPTTSQLILEVHDQLLTITSFNTCDGNRVKELKTLRGILNSIFRLKLSLSKNSRIPNYENADEFLKEKLRVDQYFIDLLEIYMDRVDRDK